jgi:translation initiation factor 1A
MAIPPAPNPEEEIGRLRFPRGREVIGILDQRVGGSRMKVRCMDGKVRLCRIPGKLKRKLWTREGDVLIIEPWEFGGDEKGDVVHKYRPNHIPALKEKGLLLATDDFSEF